MPEAKMPLPGMAAISLFMLGLALVGVFGVLTGRYSSGVTKISVLALCTVFAFAGMGLLRLRRWGWALALAAVFCSLCFGCYSLFRFHQPQWVFMSVINLVFFLYLVRPEVTGRLR
jgi:uncharacterized membrane protein (DUF2068 family)